MVTQFIDNIHQGICLCLRHYNSVDPIPPRPAGSRGSHSVLQVQAYSNLDLPPNSPKHRMRWACMPWAPTLRCGNRSGFVIDRIGLYGLPSDAWPYQSCSIPRCSVCWVGPDLLTKSASPPPIYTSWANNTSRPYTSRLGNKSRHFQGQETLKDIFFYNTPLLVSLLSFDTTTNRCSAGFPVTIPVFFASSAKFLRQVCIPTGSWF